MKLTKEQLTIIFKNDELNDMINDYINEWKEPLPSYIINNDILYDSVYDYFDSCQSYIIEKIKELTNVDLSEWNNTEKYEDKDFDSVLKEMLHNFNNNQPMGF